MNETKTQAQFPDNLTRLERAIHDNPNTLFEVLADRFNTTPGAMERAYDRYEKKRSAHLYATPAPAPKKVVRYVDKRGITIGVIDSNGGLYLANTGYPMPAHNTEIFLSGIDYERICFNATGAYGFRTLNTDEEREMVASELANIHGLKFTANILLCR